jgi:(2Fe-2S) ferredoxin
MLLSSGEERFPVNRMTPSDREAPEAASMQVKDIFDRPAAARRLMVCTGPCCNRTGEAQALLEALRARLLDAGNQDAGNLDGGDLIGAVSCVRRSCLGKCTGEPLAYVEPDGVWYHRLSVENLLLILREHVLNHRPMRDLILEEDD